MPTKCRNEMSVAGPRDVRVLRLVRLDGHRPDAELVVDLLAAGELHLEREVVLVLGDTNRLLGLASDDLLKAVLSLERPVTRVEVGRLRHVVGSLRRSWS
jgi:hypothetical protein